jgi:MYXO-CTERM domain-containing protein
MTSSTSPALPPLLHRSECFAEDLCEVGALARPHRQPPRPHHRHFPFPITAYPASPLAFPPSSLKPGTQRAGSMALPRGLRHAVAGLVLAAAALPGSAWASLVSYSYAGVVDYDDGDRGWIDFSGQLVFESSTPDQIADPSTADYKVSAAPNGNWPNGFNVTFNSGENFSFNHFLDILVSNNLGGTDQWGAQAHDSGASDSLGLTLTDFSQAVFDSDALPLPVGGLLLSMFTISEFKFESAEGLLSGHLTDLHCVAGCDTGTTTPPTTTVPEPQSLALVLAGLGALGLLARRPRPA